LNRAARAPLSLSPVPVYTIARVGLTRRRVTELIALLESKLAEHDRQVGH
jgi:hypothetical protein